MHARSHTCKCPLARPSAPALSQHLPAQAKGMILPKAPKGWRLGGAKETPGLFHQCRQPACPRLRGMRGGGHGARTLPSAHRQMEGF